MRWHKRAFDLVCTVPSLVLLAPLFLGIALLVKVADGGPVFYRQVRAGYRGRPFRLWKFRTMIPDAEKRGPPITVGSDSRITRVGVLLRRFKLDELPQVFNVLVGEMSLVGPRPEVPRYVRRYTREQRRVLDLVPGVTDPASLRYRQEATLLGQTADPERRYLEDVLPEKIRLSLDYAARATRWSDLWIVLRTLGALVRRPRGASGALGGAAVQSRAHPMASRRSP